jgi:UDP-glucose:(heptosyl)LPS alpha-1,3-glucosyltransferase
MLMRIALLSRRFDHGGGGTERDLIVTAKCLIEAGHAVTIYAAEIRGDIQRFNLKRVAGFAPGRAAALLRFAWAAPAAARRDGADLVVSFARAVGADVMRSGGGAHVSYVRAARQWRGGLAWRAMWASPYHRVQMFIERRGFRSPRLRRAIAVSNLVRDDLIREFGLQPEKVATLYNGVDLERFTLPRDDGARREMRGRLGIGNGAPLAAFVGNGFSRKGLRFLIEAWPRVERGAHLLVVGSDRAEARYRAAAERAGVGGRIHFAGARSDVPEIFRAVDVFALPSLFEPFGNVVMEAMASGLPVLSSAKSGVSELLPEAMKPFIVANPTDCGEIARRMNAMLANYRELGAAARAAAERYPWTGYGERLLAILTALA